MCNLYSVTKSQQAIPDLVKAIRDLTGNYAIATGVISQSDGASRQDRPGRGA